MSDRKPTNPTFSEYARSFEHASNDAASSVHAEQEFPGYDPKAMVNIPRRRFMKFVGASAALAGLTLTGCRRWPREHIVAAVAGERGRMPGVPEIYASCFEIGGVASAVWVTQIDGRPIKVEGNPLHPLFRSTEGKKGSFHEAGLGACDVFSQAALLDMYDPVRSRRPIKRTGGDQQLSDWATFKAEFDAAAASGGVAVLSEAGSGLSHAAAKQSFLARHREAIWVEHEALSTAPESAGVETAFGKPGRAVYHLDKARIIASFDADLLGSHPNKLYHGIGWAKGRRSADEAGTMNRLHLAESAMSQTGAVADHRMPAQVSRIAAMLVVLAGKLGVNYTGSATLNEKESAFVDRVAADLIAAGASGVVAVGSHLPASVQALAHAINAKLQSQAVTYHALPTSPDAPAKLKALADAMRSGSVKTLLILGGNPAYDAPADVEFAKAIEAVPFKAHLSHYDNETSRFCTWHLSRAHALESWGDARAWDGTISIQQPLILPLYDSKSVLETVSMLVDETPRLGMDLVRSALSPLLADEAAWRTALHDGLIAGSAYPALATRVGTITVETLPESKHEVRFLASLTHDGRFANNGWLQETPDSITKLVWDNAALINKNDADELGLKQGEIVMLTVNGKSVELPLYVLWGQPRGVIGVQLGYGRPFPGPIGEGVGFDVYPLRTLSTLGVAAGATLAKTGKTHKLVSTQDFHQVAIGDFPGQWAYAQRVDPDPKRGQPLIVRDTTLTEMKSNPGFLYEGIHRLPLVQLYDAPFKRPQAHPDAPEFFNYPHAWGMAIDMSSCIGCNACLVACQSENNIPVIGKGMIEMNRDMNWIRLDRYFKGDADNPQVVFQPMMCVQCENAPCEQVCPVAATVHDTEGLNTMVYNRCIGTRYCANNCPYKARRFNYFDWHARDPRTGYGLGLVQSAWLGFPDTQTEKTVDQISRMKFNPDVTVRMRGVMEKCTYCTQRIKSATIQRKNEWNKAGRDEYYVEDLDIATACMQACPTQAIVFGNLNDPNSRVSKLFKSRRTYVVLEELNTRPRTKYMAKVRNPAEA
jgi:molybdopterin-containing oxidoreductase family iron-sulfur binding subunit